MEFKEHLRKYLSENEIEALVSTFEGKEHKGLILNIEKLSDEQFVTMFPNVKKHPFVEHAYLYDQDEYQFGKMDLHDLGAYYIQDPSASLVSWFLSPKENEHVLDMCAAPGGKSVQASFLMNQKGVLYSNDLSNERSFIIYQNMERLGLKNMVIFNKDLSKINGLENSFDRIVLDAPCSGSGMFRKNDAMKTDWTYEKVLKNSAIQKELILLGYSFLKEGGTMVYSTCSYSYEEDEEVIQYLLENTDAELVKLPESSMFYRTDKMPEVIHLFPNLIPGEGHFIALIKKPGELQSNKNIEKFKTNIKDKNGVQTYYELPMKPIEKFYALARYRGLEVGSIKYANKGLEMSHHYARSLKPIESNSYELTDEEYKKYIHGETIDVKENKNYTTVSYKGLVVGVVRQVGSTLKNLYPKGLRR